jgi:hypothetical protein
MSQEDKNVEQKPAESLADLEVPAEDANHTNAGGTASKREFEIKDFSFGVENPTTIG